MRAGKVEPAVFSHVWMVAAPVASALVRSADVGVPWMACARASTPTRTRTDASNIVSGVKNNNNNNKKYERTGWKAEPPTLAAALAPHWPT